MIKVGLIGAGFMGQMHATCYKELKAQGMSITAVADLRSDKAEGVAKDFNANIYKDGMDLIKNADVDVIDICLPTNLHFEHAIASIKSNRHTFIEKPVCLNEDEANILLEFQKETNKLIMVGQCIRLWDEYVYLKDLIDSKKYGKVISGVFTRISPLPTWSYNNWLHKTELSGGLALDMHIHDTDYIRYILGEPENVNSTASRNNQGVIQQIFTTYKYKETTIMAEACWDYPDTFPFTMEYRVKLEKATIVYNSGKSPSLVVYGINEESFTPKLDYKANKESDIGGNVSSLGGYYNELEYFMNCINNNKEIEIAPLSEGIKSLKLVLKEIESAGGVIKK